MNLPDNELGVRTADASEPRPSAADAEPATSGGFAKASYDAAPGVMHVLRILARHGFVRALRGNGHWPTPAHVREALEELGVLYLKFGQVLAMRRDLLPDAYIAELERLLDRLPPMPQGSVREIVERELGHPLGELFTSFDEMPMAAATIAQVHRATLRDGRDVVVKVRRADVGARVAADLPTLIYLAALAERMSPPLRAFDLVGMVREFRESLGREMDFRLEARSIARFRAALADTPGVWIPDTVAALSTQAVLTEEFSAGERIDEYAEMHPDAKRHLAESISALVMHQVFETGLFHADPHPGNVFVLPDGRLCLHDFGMIGELDEAMRDALGSLLDSSTRADVRGVADAYLELGLVSDDIDRTLLEAELAPVVRRLHERPIKELSIGEALESLVRVGSRHRVRNPGVILLLTRAFLIAESLMRRLDPQMNVLEVFEAELPRLAAARRSPARLAAAGRALLFQLERFVREAPNDVRRTLHRVADGELGRVRVPGLEAISLRASRDLERLTAGVSSAALLISGALLTIVPGWHRTAGDVLLLVGVVSTLAFARGALRKSRE